MNITANDQDVILQQRPIWSSAIIWSIVLVTASVVAWASLTKVESAISATGKLEPTGSVKEIQTPVAGVVETIHIKEGSRVTAGQTLLNLVPTNSKTELAALTRVRNALELENQYYRSQLNSNIGDELTEDQIETIKLSPQILSLTRSRQALLQENRLYQQQLSDRNSSDLALSDRARQQAGVDEFQSRLATSALEVPQIDKQLQEAQVQQNGIQQQIQLQLSQRSALNESNIAKIAQIDGQINENQLQQAGLTEQIGSLNQQLQQGQQTSQYRVRQIDKQIQQNRLERQKKVDLLQINTDLLARVQNLVREGAVSKVREFQQQQQVITIESDIKQLDEEYARLELEKPSILSESSTREQELARNIGELRSQLAVSGKQISRLNSQKQEIISTGKAELQERSEKIANSQNQIVQLGKTQERLTLARSQAQEKVKNTEAGNRKDLYGLMASNTNKIAEIDSQLSKAVVENQKRLAEVEGQIDRAKLTLQYMEVKAPVSGTIFELKPKQVGFVARESEPVLKIVPDDSLVAQVYITNRDIGFVRQGMKVDLRVESFPFSEFGDIKGELIEVGKDALAPDQIYPYYRFPAKVRLDRDYISVKGDRKQLQSGMAVSANILVRERSVMSVFTDLFVPNMDSLRYVK
jgi:hemolysin D